MAESLAVRFAKHVAPDAASEADRGSSTLARVNQVLDGFTARDHAGELLTAVRHYPARAAQWAEFPEWVQSDLRSAYGAKGIRQLYTHQAAAAEAVHAGKNVVIVTPTASGKTLCYNLPVLNAILAMPIPARCISSPPKPWPRINSPNCMTSSRVANRSESSPMTAIRPAMPAKPSARRATSF